MKKWRLLTTAFSRRDLPSNSSSIEAAAPVGKRGQARKLHSNRKFEPQGHWCHTLTRGAYCAGIVFR